MVSELDEKMLSLNEAIQECIEHQANRDNMNDVLNNVIGSGPEQKSLNMPEKKSEYEQKEAKDIDAFVSFRYTRYLKGEMIHGENRSRTLRLYPCSHKRYSG